VLNNCFDSNENGTSAEKELNLNEKVNNDSRHQVDQSDSKCERSSECSTDAKSDLDPRIDDCSDEITTQLMHETNNVKVAPPTVDASSNDRISSEPTYTQPMPSFIETQKSVENGNTKHNVVIDDVAITNASLPITTDVVIPSPSTNCRIVSVDEAEDSNSKKSPSDEIRNDVKCTNAVRSDQEQETRKSSRRIQREKSQKIGEVGYSFTKLFPGFGLFNGMVVAILFESEYVNDNNRRVVYTDGDSEDLSLSDLKILARLYPKRLTEELAKAQVLEVKSQNKKDSKVINQKSRPSHESIAISEQATATEAWDKLDEVGEFEKANELLPPVDMAAESTLKLYMDERRKKTGSDLSSDEEEWLSEVAVGFLKPSKSSRSQKKDTKNNELPIANIEKDKVDNTPLEAKATMGKEKVLKSSDLLRLRSLANVSKGERHGCRVVKVKLADDKIVVVGEVILEHKGGWVEVIDGKVVRKGRVGDYRVVPSDYTVGECIVIDNDKSTLSSESTQQTHLSSPRMSVAPSSSVYIEPKIALESLFYWKCHRCFCTTFFLRTTCGKCNTHRSSKESIPSALLNIAEVACDNASTLDEAYHLIPAIHRSAIPQHVLVQCIDKIQSHSQEKVSSNRNSHTPLLAGSYFYWNCGYCTYKNSYKIHKCKCCGHKRNNLAEFSVLFDIVRKAAKTAVNVDEAMAKIPSLHAPAIPRGVMNSLVTCIASTSKDNRRCLRMKLPGSDFCTIHDDPNEVAQNDIKRNSVDDENASPRKKRRLLFKSVASLKSDVSNFLKSVSPYHMNDLKWNVQCVEDVFLSERNTPFALGLKLRRYFPGYGFHDGRIHNIEIKTVNETGQERPVLVYRVVYNDGDREDLLHHEVNSLRQMYDQTNIAPWVSPKEQIFMGSRYETLLGHIEIKNIDVCITNKTDNGQVTAKFRKVKDAGWTDISLELTKLQVTIVRKYTNEEALVRPSPAVDWSFKSEFNALKSSTQIEECLGEKIIMSEPAMFISRQPIPYKTATDDNLVIPQCSNQCSNDDIVSSEHQNDDEYLNCVRPDVEQHGWDPAGGLDYVAWDPYDDITCEKCKKGDNERLIMICDECHSGYHTYCLRPVVSTIPADEWLCPECSSAESGRAGFESLVKQLGNDFSKVSSFLSLPFNNRTEFEAFNKEALDFFTSPIPRHQRFAAFGLGKKKRTIATIGGVNITRKQCKYMFVLPEPHLQPKVTCHSFATMVASMKYCGVSNYSEDLVYADGVTEDMNDVSLDTVEKLSKDNSSMFNLFKENLKRGIYPPIEIVYDEEKGFTVKALCNMPRHTILTEYVGEVTTIEKCHESRSDSLMILLDTKDPKTSLIIDPTRTSNIARFFGGVNNKNLMSKRKVNVRTRRFGMDGKSRVALFTARAIEAGESLNYDYNAGIGTSVGEILRTGFYDTSKFF